MEKNRTISIIIKNVFPVVLLNLKFVTIALIEQNCINNNDEIKKTHTPHTKIIMIRVNGKPIFSG